MLVVNLKPAHEILPFLGDRVVAVCCEGCREVHYPEDAVFSMLDEVSVKRTLMQVIAGTYICSMDNLKCQLTKYSDVIKSADSVLIVACGVGTQTAADFFNSSDERLKGELSADNDRGNDVFCGTFDGVSYKMANVVTACNSISLPGSAGVSPSGFSCDLCGECHLNATGGICPITSCSKHLVNGPCGGVKDGMCEINKKLRCGWEDIAVRLSLLSKQATHS